MATGPEIRAFAQENGCTDALALKVLTLQAHRTKLVEALRDAYVALPGGSWAHIEKPDGICRCKGCMKKRIPALLVELGEQGDAI